MRIGSKIFPYPVLNNIQQLSNYLGYKFDILYNYEETPLEFKFKDLRFETDSDYLNELYENEIIKVACIVECSDTVFRQKYEIDKDGIDLVLYKADLSEKTNITFFAYANEKFIMKSDEFEEDYQNIEFDIDKYDILAANDDQYITVKHQEKEYDLAHSIFAIVNDHSKDDGRYSVQYTQSKITIYLSDEDYSNYKVIANLNEYKEVFFNILLIPSLVAAITSCKNDLKDDTTIEDIGDKYHWFRSIVKSYKKLHGTDLTIDLFKDEKSIELAQELLGKPLNIAFKKMIEEKNVPQGDE